MEKAPSLRLKFTSDNDGTGELTAYVESNGFSGVSSAWFDSIALLEFAKRLEMTYPIKRDQRIILQGGYWNDHTIEQLHLGLQFYPIDSSGIVGCYITLRTPMMGVNRAESAFEVSAELQTTYNNLHAFSHSLQKLFIHQINEATLIGES